MGEKNYEKKSPSPLELPKPKPKPDPAKSLGGAALKGSGVKKPGK